MRPGKEGGGEGRGGGVGVLRWWTLLMVPMRLGDVSSIDFERDSLMKKKWLRTGGPIDGHTLL